MFFIPYPYLPFRTVATIVVLFFLLLFAFLSMFFRLSIDSSHPIWYTEDKEEIKAYIENYCKFFGGNAEELLKSDFFVLTPDSGNPYKQLYVQN